MSDFLSCPARLVHMAPDEWRGSDPRYAEGFRVSFVDGSRPDEPVPTQPGGRGRRTLWGRRVAQERIGQVEMEAVKPCARCTVITVDQSEGVADREPLATLSGYRGTEGKVYLGQNLVHLGTGQLGVGDRVELLEVGDPRPLLT